MAESVLRAVSEPFEQPADQFTSQLGCGDASSILLRYPASDRVAPGRYRPGAPTDPYVPALGHTAPRITGSLRVCKLNGPCVPGPAESAGGVDERMSS